jgi:hypothetical protein
MALYDFEMGRAKKRLKWWRVQMKTFGRLRGTAARAFAGQIEYWGVSGSFSAVLTGQSRPYHGNDKCLNQYSDRSIVSFRLKEESFLVSLMLE